MSPSACSHSASGLELVAKILISQRRAIDIEGRVGVSWVENWGEENAAEGADGAKAGAVKVTDSKVGVNEMKKGEDERLQRLCQGQWRYRTCNFSLSSSFSWELLTSVEKAFNLHSSLILPVPPNSQNAFLIGYVNTKPSLTPLWRLWGSNEGERSLLLHLPPAMGKWWSPVGS